MHGSPFHYPPLANWALVVLFVLLGLAIALVEFNVLSYAYERIGVSRRYIFLLLLASLLGSYVNIPVAELPPERVESNREVNYWGVPIVVPVVERWPGTVIAVNLGGAVIPTLLSVYLVIRNGVYLRSVIGVAIVAAIVHMLAKPVAGVGIAVPIFIPPIAAAIVALVISRAPIPEPMALPTVDAENVAPALAYIVGSMGTLLGADLLNLGQIQGLGAPIASIGGAGTFDGIFLTGILAVLLA